jgi:hypothetical protein
VSNPPLPPKLLGFELVNITKFNVTFTNFQIN